MRVFKRALLQPEQVESLLSSFRNKKLILSLISILLGITLQLDLASMNQFGTKYDLSTILVNSVIFGIIIGVIYWLCLSALIYWFGRLFSGTASWRSTYLFVGWAGVLFLMKLIIWLVKIILLGDQAFINPSQEVSGHFFLTSIYLLLIVLDVIFTVLYFIILVKYIAHVHNFSISQGLLVGFICFTLLILVQVLIQLLLAIS